ncbi:MAG: hypothetical protein IPM34_14815 [Saprospiraceae bacterium]|nr:hypothetical protein [Saprospiraceae bacterium]
MKQTVLIITLFFIGLNVVAQSDSTAKKKWLKETRLTALIDSRTAFEFNNSKFSKSELIIRPELEMPFSKNIRLFASARAYSEWLDILEPNEPTQDEISDYSKRYLIGDRLEFELREFYIDWKIKKHYLTIGKQQIVWGEADGLKILDVVNPINLREFLLDDFDQSRIPLWSVKADLNFGKIKTQLIWIPDNTYHDIPDSNSPFFPSAFFPSPPSGISLVQHPLNRPNKFIEDSDAGIRLSAFLKGWDITLNYLYAYDDFPVAKSTISIDTIGFPVINIHPSYKRYHLVGGTFNNSFKSVTLRGEIGVSLNKSFNTTDANVTEGIFQTEQVAVVIGLDYSGISNTTISGQIFADYVATDYTLLGREALELNATLLLSRNFKNETITTDLILVQNLNKGDGFVRPKIKWQVLNNLILSLGADIIYGDEKRLFGQFRDRSRLVFSIQLGI